MTRMWAVAVAAVVLFGCGPSREEANRAFLDAAAAEPGAIRTSSGMVYLELEAGEGAQPGPSSTVLVDYVGRFTDGWAFDHGNGVDFALDEVIRCFSEGLQQMQEGGRAKLTCPPELGYGEEDYGPIPGQSVLQFEVTLVRVLF